jgi:hypothetical protein
MELLSRLLPQGASLHLETAHLDEVAAQLTLRVTSRQALGHCPVCRFPTRRIHSYYKRTLADLVWSKYSCSNLAVVTCEEPTNLSL